MKQGAEWVYCAHVAGEHPAQVRDGVNLGRRADGVDVLLGLCELCMEALENRALRNLLRGVAEDTAAALRGRMVKGA